MYPPREPALDHASVPTHRVARVSGALREDWSNNLNTPSRLVEMLKLLQEEGRDAGYFLRQAGPATAAQEDACRSEHI
ncbi:hypothetical protein D3C76_1842390 [compost metagenome]